MKKIRFVAASVLVVVMLLPLTGCFSTSYDNNYNEDADYAYDDADYADYAYDKNNGDFDDSTYDNSDAGYIQTVKSCNLYSDFQGVTIGEVINTYVQSPDWTYQESYSGGSGRFVTVKGNFKEESCPLALTFSITDIPDQPDMVYVKLFSANYNNESLTSDESEILIYYMFSSYYNGYAKISDWLNDTAEANDAEADNGDLPAGFYWVEEPKVVKKYDMYRAIVGVIRNESGVSRSVEIKFNLYDSSGYLVDTASAYSNVDNGTSWKFETASFKDFSSYEFAGVEIY